MLEIVCYLLRKSSVSSLDRPEKPIAIAATAAQLDVATLAIDDVNTVFSRRIARKVKGKDWVYRIPPNEGHVV